MDRTITLTIADDDRFLRATKEQLADMDYRTPDGILMKPILKDGNIVGFTATAPDGSSVPVMALKMDSGCYYCVCVGSGSSTTCQCTEVLCSPSA
jgi:hypothetical protein